jgi:hypothetical protein
MTVKFLSNGSERADHAGPERAGTKAAKKARVAQPPYLNLQEAVQIAGQIYEQGGGRADSNLLTVILRNSTSSSSFTRKLQSLRWYHLTAGMVPPVTLTDAALAIVAPKDENARLAGLKSAAIGPDPFRRTYDRLKGKLLPQKEFLINGFQHDLNVPKEIATAWADSFAEALETAQLLLSRQDGKIQVLEGASVLSSDEESAIDAERGSSTPSPSEAPVQERPPSAAVLGGEGHTTRIALSDGRTATISIPDRLTQRDATRLKGALVGISAIIDSMVEESDG